MDMKERETDRERERAIEKQRERGRAERREKTEESFVFEWSQ